VIDSAELKKCAHENCGCPAKSGSLLAKAARVPKRYAAADTENA